jgi:hypothetical protein
MSADVSVPHVNTVAFRLAAVLLVLGAALMVLSVPIDPPPTAAPDPRGTIEAYTASPGRMDIAATLLHNGFLFLGLGLFLTGLFVTARGKTLAMIGAVASGIGFADLSGAVLIDWFDSAAGRTVGVDAAVRIGDTAVLPGLVAGWFVPQIVGSALGPVILLVGLVRAGWVGSWTLALPVAAAVAALAVEGPLGAGLSFAIVLLLALVLARVLWSRHQPHATGP